QIFGNGKGDIVCMGERECSIQRRHQKIIEETPSPFLVGRPGTFLSLIFPMEHIVYLGTVEFLVNNHAGDFFFLEMNTRIQVPSRF
ncbi:carbamoyl-phosphate synthetase large subunit-like protein, partial [Mycena leptocephala]